LTSNCTIFSSRISSLPTDHQLAGLFPIDLWDEETEQMLAILDEALFTLMTSEQGPQDWRHFQNALLKVDCLGTLKYGREAFLQAANSRFSTNFDYTQQLNDAVTMQGWGGCEAARSFAQIQMMDAPAGPDISLDLQLILEGTALEEFADAFFEGQVDVNNMHDLRAADLLAMGMDVHQASSFYMYISQPNGEVWPVGFVPEESDSETDSYESVLGLPE
jgi:hypothetical protein